MRSFKKESSLVKPVRASLRRRGFRRVQQEVQFYEYSMDLYAYSKAQDTTTAIELKLTRWSRAFQQALIYQLCADFVYVALPMATVERVDKSLFECHGVGLIGVRPGPRCVTVIEPKRSNVLDAQYREFYVSLLQGEV
ncbi:MAG TPA: hypothetical protein VD997_13345 [Phycisphaerales bacterium]|nr:hypothetical protein [Phycisphaerales bacterium]